MTAAEREAAKNCLSYHLALPRAAILHWREHLLDLPARQSHQLLNLLDSQVIPQERAADEQLDQAGQADEPAEGLTQG